MAYKKNIAKMHSNNDLVKNMATLYSSLKFLHFHDHLESIKSNQIIAPVHIRIKPINNCNHDCWYCA
jgi:hypothetical protein